MKDNGKTLYGRKLYIPQMSYEGARCMAAAFQSVGVDAEPAPDPDVHSFEEARKYLSGDECLPEAVTLGSFFKIAEQKDYKPRKTAFMMPTANGPCRFGHYLHLGKLVFEQRGEEEAFFFSPSSNNGYGDIGINTQSLVRTAWRAVVASDILRKLLLKTRPYEGVTGTTDKVFNESLDWVCDAISARDMTHGHRMEKIVNAFMKVREAFHSIDVDRRQKRLLIGIVGEIFCRLSEVSNKNLLRLIEKYGGEVWMSDVAEWVWYTNDEEKKKLIRYNKRLSFNMLGCKLRHAIMHADEKRVSEIFKDDFIGYEEPHPIAAVLERSRPYLPREGAHGEMVINVGKAVWYYEKGAAGVIDISPFTCMNGIVCESVYPHVSKDLGGFPIRVFYFDGLHSNIGSDIEIFMELARNYKAH